MTSTALARAAHACALATLVTLVGGCAVGQRFNYQGSAVPMTRVAATGTVAVAVQDRRPYVVSNNKPESFVGLMRGGYGNPFDANTASGAPLAQEMREALLSGLRAKNVTVKPVVVNPGDGGERAQRILAEAGARRSVLITLNEWKTDTYINTDLHYDVTLQVLNDKGVELARTRANGRDNIGTSPHSAAGAAFTRKFGALFDEEKIVQALK